MVRLAFIFPGQGSQYVGMGRDLYEKFEKVKAIFIQGEKESGLPLRELSFNGPEDKLNDTRFAQPALLTASVACLELLKERGLEPALAAGHSLGEYTALVAAEAITFGEAIRLVKKRGEFMQEESLRNPGGMAAVIGLSAETIRGICCQANELGRVDIANMNSAEQVVISGKKGGLEKAKELAFQAGAKKIVDLKVSGAFHSSFMRRAGERLNEELIFVPFKKARVPVVVNFSATAETEPQVLKDYLGRQMTSPVRWEESMRLMIREKINTFIEVGPGRVLQGLLKRINRDLNIYGLEDEKSLKEVVEAMKI